MTGHGWVRAATVLSALGAVCTAHALWGGEWLWALLLGGTTGWVAWGLANEATHEEEEEVERATESA